VRCTCDARHIGHAAWARPDSRAVLRCAVLAAWLRSTSASLSYPQSTLTASAQSCPVMPSHAQSCPVMPSMPRLQPSTAFSGRAISAQRAERVSTIRTPIARAFAGDQHQHQSGASQWRLLACSQPHMLAMCPHTPSAAAAATALSSLPPACDGSSSVCEWSCWRCAARSPSCACATSASLLSARCSMASAVATE